MIIFSMICILLCIFFSSQGGVLYFLDKPQNLFVAEIFVTSLCAPALQVLFSWLPPPTTVLASSALRLVCQLHLVAHFPDLQNHFTGGFPQVLPRESSLLPTLILVRFNMSYTAPVLKMHCFYGIIFEEGLFPHFKFCEWVRHLAHHCIPVSSPGTHTKSRNTY